VGGGGADWGRGIAVDSTGCAYLAGDSDSFDFPTENAYDDSHNGDYDVFVTKLSASGNTLAFSTYLGGEDLDRGNDIALDGAGCAYLTGLTLSFDFPTENAYDNGLDGGDAFITKLSASGNTLAYSTYLGGDDYEHGYGIAVDDYGCAYLTGATRSTDFPLENPYDDSYNDDWWLDDAFITKLSASGNTLVYSTYLGGSRTEFGNSIAVDGNGCVYLTGRTLSSDFPTENAYDDSYNVGGADVFITKLFASGNILAYSTYLGGNGAECGFGITVNGDGCAYLTGFTGSDNFPTQNAYDDSYNSGFDAFVAKFENTTNVNRDTFIPEEFFLSESYPNPFNSSVLIKYTLSQRRHVVLEIYDILGRKVEALIDQQQQAGYHHVVWNAEGKSTGIYFYKIQAGDFTQSKKMVLIK